MLCIGIVRKQHNIDVPYLHVILVENSYKLNIPVQHISHTDSVFYIETPFINFDID
jgi:hypothetical protein